MADPKIDSSSPNLSNPLTVDNYDLDASKAFEKNKEIADPENSVQGDIISESVGKQNTSSPQPNYLEALFGLNEAKKPFANYEPPEKANSGATFQASCITTAFSNPENTEIFQKRVDGKKDELISKVPGDPHSESAQKEIESINKEADTIQSMLKVMGDLNDNTQEVQQRLKELEKV